MDIEMASLQILYLIITKFKVLYDITKLDFDPITKTDPCRFSPKMKICHPFILTRIDLLQCNI